MRLRPTGRAATSHAGTIRRRRLTALATAIAVVGAVVLGVVGLSGSGGPDPRYVPGGGASASVISAPGVTRAPRHTADPAPFRAVPAAASLAATLPLEQQVSQLFLVSLDRTSPSAGRAPSPSAGTTGTGGTGSTGTAGVATPSGPSWGGVVFTASNFVSDSQAAGLTASVSASARSAGDVPPLIAATQAGGTDTALADLPPQAQPVIGASDQAAAAAGAQAIAAAKRLRALGFNMTLAPLADVDTPGGPLTGRLFSTDPAAVASLSLAAVAGYAASGVISAVGHFPGTGGASADPDQMTATVGGSLGDLRARDLVPFAAVTPRAPVILMSNAAYAALDGVTPAGLLGAAVDLLRGAYGFRGVVMSDDLDATLLATGADPGTAALSALRAGDDLLYISGAASEHQAAYGAVLAAARGSAALRARIHDALLRVLSLKANYGILR